MKNNQLLRLGSVTVLLALFGSCEKEPDQLVETKDESILKVYAGTTAGHQDGPVLEARFEYPTLIAIGPDKSLYVVDGGFASGRSALLFPGKRIRKITPDGIVSTFFDSNQQGSVQGINGIAVNKAGDVYISDGDQIKKISPDGMQVSLVAGTGSHETMKDGPAMGATFYEPSSLAFDKNGCLYIMDTHNNAIRFYSNGKVTTIAGGERVFFPNYDYSGGLPPLDGNGINAQFDSPQFLALGTDGNIYVSGGYFPVIRKVTPGGEVTTITSSGGPYNSEILSTSRGLAFHPDGTLYVNQNGGWPVRGSFGYSVSSVLLPDVIFTQLALNQYSIDDHYPLEDENGYPSSQEPGLNSPTGMVVRDNVLYICNTNSHKILKIELE